MRRTRVDTLIVTLLRQCREPPDADRQQAVDLPVEIRLSAHSQKLRYRPRAYSHIGNLALPDVFDKPLGDWGLLLKLLEDKPIASLALFLLAPVKCCHRAGCEAGQRVRCSSGRSATASTTS